MNGDELKKMCAAQAQGETNYGNPETISAERVYNEAQKVAELREAAVQRLTYTITTLEEQVKALYALQKRLVSPPVEPPVGNAPPAYRG